MNYAKRYVARVSRRKEGKVKATSVIGLSAALVLVAGCASFPNSSCLRQEDRAVARGAPACDPYPQEWKGGGAIPG